MSRETTPRSVTDNRLPSSLCETCLERGRKRLGTHEVGKGMMCDPCFRGAPFSHREEIGGYGANSTALIQGSARDRRYYLRHRKRKISRQLAYYRRKKLKAKR